MSKQNKQRPVRTADDDLDVGMEDMAGFFDNVSRHVDTPAPKPEPTPEPKKAQTSRTPKAKKKKSLLTKKQGLYFSEKLDERLDKEWRNQARGSRKSKSLIVENILREYWKLPQMEE
jgi:hypothetical protein